MTLPEFAKQKQRQGEGLSRADRRDGRQRMSGEPADGADLRHHHGNQTGGRFHLDGPEDSGNFCTAGGRFGTHSSNENMTPIYYNRVVFIAHFNAGVRAVDIRDPYRPRKSAITSRPSPTRPTSAASARARTSIARSRSRPTTSKWTTAAISTPSIAPIPACTSSSSPARRVRRPTSLRRQLQPPADNAIFIGIRRTAQIKSISSLESGGHIKGHDAGCQAQIDTRG